MVKLKGVSLKNINNLVEVDAEEFEKNLDLLFKTALTEHREFLEQMNEYYETKASGFYYIKYYFLPQVKTYIYKAYKKKFGFGNDGYKDKNGLEQPRKEDG